MAEYRRRLPHFQPEGEYLFVTCRLHGSLPVAEPPLSIQLLAMTSPQRESNLLWGRAGEPFWQHESYDHWVENAKEFCRIVAYIEENPVKAGLSATPEDWPWSSAARAS